MKILFLGEYSNVHFHLKQGLEELGHDVTLITSDGGWRKYYSDIPLTRKSASFVDGMKYLFSLMRILPKLKDFDVVQINNPADFFQLRAKRNLKIYEYLRKRNKKIFQAAYATDYFWVKACVEDGVFRYCEYVANGKFNDNKYNVDEINVWSDDEKKDANIRVAESCNGIIACLYEYYAAYKNHFPKKTTFIPLPVNLDEIKRVEKVFNPNKIKFFIGIQKAKNELKGTDIMLKALERLHEKYPDKVEIIKAVSVPYKEYEKMMNEADVLLDQLYSYTPAMNALIAMAKGIILVGGGEPENYEILNENKLRPIINVLPNEDDVFQKLEWLVLNSEKIPRLSAESRAYVEKHHCHRKVARQYIDCWEKQ